MNGSITSPLALYMQSILGGQSAPPQPPPQPSSLVPQLGQGPPQQLAFTPPGAQASPLAQALQTQPAAQPPAAQGGGAAGALTGAAGAMPTWLTNLMPWLSAAQFVAGQSSQPVTIGGGRGGGFATSGEGLL